MPTADLTTTYLPVPGWLWVSFHAVVLLILWLELRFPLGRLGNQTVRAFLATFIWISLSALFGGVIFGMFGGSASLQFFTGYAVEYSLSLDNVFLFLLIFRSFQVNLANQKRVLLLGVVSALFLRAGAVFGGLALLHHFETLTYIFGAYILHVGVKLLFPKPDPKVEELCMVRLVRHWVPVIIRENETHFFVRVAGRLNLTVLGLVLVAIEGTDLLFAVDSIPAVFAVSRDPFIVYTSNICAILGLRSLYFLMAGAMQSLAYLHHGLAAILIFVGIKMIAEPFLGSFFHQHSSSISLAYIGGVMGITVAVSIWFPPREKSQGH